MKMNKVKKFLFYAIPILLGGCIPIMSINPFFNESDVIFESKLLGTWVQDANDPETTWIFSKSEDPNNAYQLTFIDKEGKKGSYTAVLMKLDDKLFLDVYPDKMPWDTEDSNDVDLTYNTFFLIPSHSVIKIDSIEPKLVLRITDETEFKDFIKEHPDAIEYTKSEDTYVLTSSTKELQAFILKYSGDEKLFPGKIELGRTKE